MFGSLLLWIGAFLRLLRSRQSLLVENLALRQQVACSTDNAAALRLLPPISCSGSSFIVSGLPGKQR